MLLARSIIQVNNLNLPHQFVTYPAKLSTSSPPTKHYQHHYTSSAPRKLIIFQSTAPPTTWFYTHFQPSLKCAWKVFQTVARPAYPAQPIGLRLKINPSSLQMLVFAMRHHQDIIQCFFFLFCVCHGWPRPRGTLAVVPTVVRAYVYPICHWIQLSERYACTLRSVKIFAWVANRFVHIYMHERKSRRRRRSSMKKEVEVKRLGGLGARVHSSWRGCRQLIAKRSSQLKYRCIFILSSVSSGYGW